MHGNVGNRIQDTIDSTVSSLQSNLQQDVEPANALRKSAVEVTAAPLNKM